MAKEFAEVAFDLARVRSDLDRYGALLRSKPVLGEREVQAFFKSAPSVACLVGAAVSPVGLTDLVAYEFEILGDYRADIVVGRRDRQFCLIELEAADPAAVFERSGKKSTKEWSAAFEHGFSQIVDWLCHLDDFKQTDRFRRNFGDGAGFAGLLLVGRDEGLDGDDLRRLRWRARNVVVNSQPVACVTYDQLHRELRQIVERLFPASDASSAT